MRVGVLGSGNVGKALATGFASRGDDVRIGSRSGQVEDPPEGVATGTFAEVAGHGELVAIAVLGAAVESAVEMAGADALAGKVVLDVTNPLEFHENAPPGLFVGHDDSGGERLQRQVPAARVVKAFNIVNFADMVDCDFPDGKPTMFIAGDDADAKSSVRGVLVDFGWDDVLDIGGIEEARLLESLCLLWVHVGLSRGEFGHAFKLLTR